MELSSEDSLRLNVMLANSVAVRIDEGSNVVYCLSESGTEARVQLNPNCRPDQYIRRVRELLSSSVLGSPGGYPVFLKRWTRMGQASGGRLGDLLMLGEPEAVIAVSGASSLTDDLARRAWWAMPNSDNARRMLRRKPVVEGEMGKVLAEFLLEFLPFEQEPRDIIESVILVLQPGLISQEQRMEIWERGRQKNVFTVGFLHAQPDELPDQKAARPDFEQYRERLEDLIARDNKLAVLLHKTMSGAGQTFMDTCIKVLKKPANQDVVVSFLGAVEGYFSDIRLSAYHFEDVVSIIAQANQALNGTSSDMPITTELQDLIGTCPELAPEIRSMIILAHVGEPIIRPIFAHTDSVGSVMRRKIEPVSKPLLAEFENLRSV